MQTLPERRWEKPSCGKWGSSLGSLSLGNPPCPAAPLTLHSWACSAPRSHSETQVPSMLWFQEFYFGVWVMPTQLNGKQQPAVT